MDRSRKTIVALLLVFILVSAILPASTHLNKSSVTALISNVSRPSPISWYNKFPGGWASGYWPA